MKAWDTNFLIRHLTEDDEAQLETVRRELRKSERAGKAVWISGIVLIETAWVLKAYGLGKNEVLDTLQALCQDARFQLEGGSDVAAALKNCRIAGDFPEHLAALSGKRAANCKTQTFDQAVANFSDFEVF